MEGQRGFEAADRLGAEAGERYLDDCRRILSDVAEAERQTAGRHGEPRGRVSLTAPVAFGRMILRPVLFDLLERYPALELSTLFLDRIAHLVEEGLDVALRIAELPDSALSAVRVGRVRRILCAAPGYLDARGRPERLSDLDDHALIDFTNMTRGGEWDLVPARYRPAAPFRVNTADVAREAALEGRGITHLLSYMIAEDAAAGRLVTILDDLAPPPVPVHVVHKEPGQTSARVRATVDHLVENLRGHPALA